MANELLYHGGRLIYTRFDTAHKRRLAETWSLKCKKKNQGRVVADEDGLILNKVEVNLDVLSTCLNHTFWGFKDG